MLAGLIILLISLYSCEDKTQTTQNQTKSDVNNILNISNNDSIAALQFLPYLLGKINSTDSIVDVDDFVVFRDSIGRRFISIIYTNLSSQSKMYVYNYHNIYDENVDEEIAALGSYCHKGDCYICTGGCSGGTANQCSGSFTPGTANPSTYVCLCLGEESPSCKVEKQSVTLTNGHKNSGLNLMNNINIAPLQTINYNIEVIQP